MKAMMAALSFGALTVTALPDAVDPARCESPSGPFASQLEVGPGCASSPLAMCTHGKLEGTIDARYEFAFHTLTPDEVDPARSNYTGTSVITLADGQQMFGEDTGYFLMRPGGEAIFETTVHVGRSAVAGGSAFGILIANGLLNFATGAGDGSYIGAYCRSSRRISPGCASRE